ncbi:MAG: UDP-N-acetyl-alpha-D-muramoyl-L-alanyl-L-glutamate epimerase [Solirubrobacteraceae bacterium]|nr:UDP-N-acetyl-alpha-D-muramoyl-L-alanyl-L-glutamate epimerase [Solirubrobacteraceae bacterium]
MTDPAQVVEHGRFDPSAYATFRFTARSLEPGGVVSLRYALDDALHFEERFELPAGGAEVDVEPLLSLLHWVAGVSYFKTAIPGEIVCETGAPPPATRALLEALYSEGLGEFAVVNGLEHVPRPAFPAGPAREPGTPAELRRVLVPVGGGKDSAVALEIVRRSGLDLALFSVGTAPPIDRTVAVAGLPRLLVRRRIDPQITGLNARGALNGHVPVTAIVSCVALLVAKLHGFDGVALANERSASFGNTTFDGIEVNHQFSKGMRAERLLADALAEADPTLRAFSVLRPASELAIARAFARMPEYHHAFTSCNRVFRLDPELRLTSWCRDCDKCRFVFLILAPFLGPEDLEAVFGSAMLDDDAQYAGFALLTATGGHKPFECVGEVEESVAAIRMLAADPRWRDQRVVRRLAAEVLPLFGADGDPAGALTLSREHAVPRELIDDVHAVLGA